MAGIIKFRPNNASCFNKILHTYLLTISNKEMTFIFNALNLILLFQMFRKRAHDFWTKFGNSDLSETRYADVSGLNLNLVPRDLSRPNLVS